MVVFTGFDPLFRDPLNRLIARAKAQGYNPQLISGQRDAYGWPGYGGQSQAELYAARGKPGGPAMAAPPGQSAHQPGEAADISGVPQGWLAANAPGVGLNTIPGDTGHVELANWRQAAATQPPTMSWDQAKAVAAANRPSQYAGPVAAETSSAGGNFAVPPGSTSLSSNPFMNSLVNIESGGRNIFSTVDKDYPGQPNSRSQGYIQADVPTWQEFAPKAGVDVSRYPTPMSAPYDVQLQGASAIPFGRFGERTRNMLSSQFGSLDNSKTIGELASRFGGGAAPAGNTMAYAGTPGAGVGPSAASGIVRLFNPDAANRMEAATQGGIGPALMAAAGGGQVGPGPGNVGPVTGFLQGAPTTGSADNSAKAAAVPGAAPAAGAAGGIAGAAQKLADSLKPQDKTDGGGQQQDAAVAAQQATAQQAAALAAAQGQRMALAAQMATQMQKGPTPLRWGKAPPGAGMGMIGAPGQGTPTPGGGMVGQGDMGMTLNSLDNLYG